MAKSPDVLRDLLLKHSLKKKNMKGLVIQNTDMIREFYSQLGHLMMHYYGQILRVKRELQFEFELGIAVSNIDEVLRKYEE